MAREETQGDANSGDAGQASADPGVEHGNRQDAGFSEDAVELGSPESTDASDSGRFGSEGDLAARDMATEGFGREGGASITGADTGSASS